MPATTSPAGCHDGTGAAPDQHTPLHTCGYSDEELIDIFTLGAKPMDDRFRGPLLNMLPEDFATEIFSTAHTEDLEPELQRGISYKLRSIAVK